MTARLQFLSCVLYVPGWKLGLGLISLLTSLVIYLSSVECFSSNRKLRHDRFLPSPLIFIIQNHFSNLRYWQRLENRCSSELAARVRFPSQATDIPARSSCRLWDRPVTYPICTSGISPGDRRSGNEEIVSITGIRTPTPWPTSLWSPTALYRAL